MENNRELLPRPLPPIKIFDLYFNSKDDLSFDVDSYSLDETMESIGIILDGFVVSLEMKGDEDPYKILNGIVSKYRPELGNAHIDPKSWDKGRNDSVYIKRRNRYLENLLVLFKLKILFAYGINSIIKCSADDLVFVDTDSSEYTEFIKLDNDVEIHSGTSNIKKFVLLKWIGSFAELFESHKITSIEYSYLYQMYYRSRTLPDFVDASSTLVNQKLDIKVEEYKKYIGFSYFAIDKTSRENLNKKLQPVIESIEQISGAFPEIKERYIEKKRGCLAGMKFLKRQYAAISGISIKGEDELGEKLRERYGISLVKLSPAVRYYFTNNRYITYHDFFDWKNMYSCKDSFLRMFSCCERKLLTVCYELKKCKNQDCLMYVTLAPCQMCIRAINSAEQELEFKVTIRCTNAVSKSNTKTETEYIELAEKINKSKK